MPAFKDFQSADDRSVIEIAQEDYRLVQNALNAVNSSLALLSERYPNRGHEMAYITMQLKEAVAPLLKAEMICKTRIKRVSEELGFLVELGVSEDKASGIIKTGYVSLDKTLMQQTVETLKGEGN